jgi:hypothetical protein
VSFSFFFLFALTASVLNDEDIQTMATKFIMFMLSTKNIGHYLVFIDPTKAINRSSESHRRCFSFCLSILAETHSTCLSGNGISSISIFIFIDKEDSKTSTASIAAPVSTSEQEGIAPMTFRGILASSPIHLSKVHIMLEPVVVGLSAYQESARAKVRQLFDPQLQQPINFYTLYPGSVSIFEEHGVDEASIPFILGSRWNLDWINSDYYFSKNQQPFTITTRRSKKQRQLTTSAGADSSLGATSESSISNVNTQLASPSIPPNYLDPLTYPRSFREATGNDYTQSSCVGPISVAQKLEIIDYWRGKMSNASDRKIA